jgi:UDP-glucuronate 4-epimerase
MKTALVTGAAGFIGSHLSERLLREGWEVTALDNFDPFYDRRIKEANVAAVSKLGKFTLVEADIRQPDGWPAALQRRFDVIVHLAARAGVRPSIEDPVGYQQTNVIGTQNLLELARAQGTKQFVFASSSSVYGVNPRVPWSEDDHVLEPISPYASTKVSGELLGHVYSKIFDMRFIALRFFTVYGPRQRPDLAIHKFARLMLEGKPLPFFGDGSTRRDYTFIADTVSGIRAAMDYDKSMYEVINLGNNRTVSLKEMVEGLETALGVRATLNRLPDQLGDVPQTWASVDKAGRLLGYAPSTSFADGLARFTEWLRESGTSPGVGGVRA